ncbi:MAG: hypothetical protein AABY04_01065 [Candidatus Micrarchaeota archaeon]
MAREPVNLSEELSKAGFNEGQIANLTSNLKFANYYKYKGAIFFIEKIKSISSTYGATDVVIRKAIASYPPFVGLDHSRVIRDATEIYGNELAVKKAILSHPKFSGLDHSRVIRNAVAIYGNEPAVKKAILSKPPFAGSNHIKALRKLVRIGKIVGIQKKEVIALVLKNPVLIGASTRRYVASLDVARELEKQGYERNENMLKRALSSFIASPYVPNTNRIRISRAKKAGIPITEPPLMKRLRAGLEVDKRKQKVE